jgi:protein arginine N-methyltransferase 1
VSLLAAHAIMLADGVRGTAYRDAIRAVVRPGDVVVDLGSGTGLLALFACQAGARRVYAIERDPSLVELAGAVARENGCADAITFVGGTSAAVEVSEPADVIVTETLGHFALEEQIVHALADARARWLKPGGRVLPADVTLIVAPIDSAEAARRIAFWDGERFGMDFRAARRWAADAVDVLRVTPDEVLARPQPFVCIDLDALRLPPPSCWARELAFELRRPGQLTGLAGWFEATLVPGIQLTTAPGAPRTHWKQAMFPLETPIDVDAGDRLTVALAALVDGRSVVWSWRGDVERPGRPWVGFDHSTIDAVTAGRASQTVVPAATPLFEAAAAVAPYVDGAATVSELAERLRRMFPDRYPSLAGAVADVAAVVRALA